VKRQIFHKLLKPEEALTYLIDHFKPRPTGIELVHLTECVGRVLAEDIVSPIDVPPFDRATMDGYAVRSIDLENASEINPVELKVVGRVDAGDKPRVEVLDGTCVEIATGAPIPPGADSVVMVEYTSERGGVVRIYRSTYPGENIAFTGTDISKGEIILRKCTKITHREIALLASVGIDRVPVFKKPRVGILSTGNEIVEPGEELDIGKIYNTNSYMIYAACIEMGCEAKIYPTCRDNEKELESSILKALRENDIVIVSGGTSAGISDVTYRVLNKIGKILIHGLLIRPGKPTVIADVDGKPVFGLPGYPNSALLVFNIIARPFISKMLCIEEECRKINAVIVKKVLGSPGRRTYIPVIVVERDGRYLAYPIEMTQGAISPVVNCDGYIVIPEDREYIDEGENVEVILDKDYRKVDLLVIGSHDIVLDKILNEISLKYKIRQVNVGSMSGILAVKSGVADMAGIHIVDEETGQYNIPILKKLNVKNAILVRGWLREQGIIIRKGNPKNIKSIEDFLRPDVRIVNRNRGAGTRILLDIYLKKISEKLGITFQELVKKIRGYTYEVKTHTAVAAAVAQGRADAGLGIRIAAEMYNLDFIPLTWEEYDILIRKDSISRKPVEEFLKIVRSEKFRETLTKLSGYRPCEDIGEVIEF